MTKVLSAGRPAPAHSLLRKNVLSRSLALALVLPFAGTALAQDAEDEAQQPEAAELDAVVVTGSRIKRAEIEGPAPVVVITAEDIEKEGFATVYEALNTLTQFTGSVQNELTQNGFTPNASFINLRGLGPGYQLILINGRRAADYPLPYNSQSNAVNLANIPAAAIARVEVLTGGASAIYGSDAVAGVVNIILKSNFEGDQLTLRGGTTTRGGGDVGQFQWVGGKTGDRWSLTYAFEALEREEIFASQRDFMDSYLDEPGVDPDDVNPVEGILVFDAFNSDRLAPDGNEATCDRFEEFDTYFFETSSVYTGPRCGYFGYPATQAIRNADSNQSIYLNGTFDFSDNVQGFAQFYHSRALATLASNTQFWASPPEQTFIYIPNVDSAALGPGGGAFVQLQRIFTPDEVGGLGAQTTEIDEKTYDFAAGIRGTFADSRFDWDATISHSEYKLDTDRPRLLENVVNDYFLGPQIGLDPYFNYYPQYELNIDRFYNPIDPAAFQALNTRVKSQADSSVTQFNVTIAGDIFELPAGPVGMAAVLEAADQDYKITPDPRTSPGYTGPDTIYNLTSTGGGGDRSRYAAGVEFSIPVLETLRANVAGRYDYYDDASAISGASTWQVGLEWRPIESLLIRGSHSTSFRAPDMHYIYADESGFFAGIFDEYRCRRDGFDPTASPAQCTGPDYSYQVFGTRSGSPVLDAEEGKSTTVGFVWDIRENMSFSLDYYTIELNKAVSDINVSELFRNEADCLLGQDRDGNPVDINSTTCQFYVNLVDRSGTGPIAGDEAVNTYRSFAINQAYNKTSGLDAAWRYQLDTDRYGNFTFALAWTHVLELEFQEFPGEPIEDRRDDPQFFNFRSRMNGSVGWEKGDWNVNVYGTRWGSLPNWAETGRIAPHLLWNVNVAKQITNNMSVGLYVNNVFDKIAPNDPTFNTYPYFWRAFSPVGREVFLQLDYRFN
jgi:outer membrane receptor protein involved in Fe transport